LKQFIKILSLFILILFLFTGCFGGAVDNSSYTQTTDSSLETESVDVNSSSGTSSVESSSIQSESQVESSVPESGVGVQGGSYEDDEFMSLDNTLRGYGHGVNKDKDNRPTGATWAQSKFGKYDAVFIAPKSENIYLTFDLGYENGYTEKILDVLKEKNAKGVFFVTKSYCKSSPKIVQRIIDEGHVLGNHSVKHKSMPSLTVEQMKSEIMDLHNFIKEKYGYEMYLFRPPMGEYSERSLAVTQSLGYQSMLWSFAYMDWDTENQPEETYAKEKMLNDAHGGAIYLIHAISKTNTAVLGDVVDGIREKGYVTAKYVIPN
jgi:peptidoglycan-N-acetylmuramic acid deacetylase